MAIVTACTPDARATSALLANVGQNKTRVIQVMFTIESEGQYHGESIRWDGWLTTDKGMLRSFESLRHCGWQGSPEEIEAFSEPNAPMNGLDANLVSLSIVMEPYSGSDEKHHGKSFAKVAWVNRIGGFQIDASRAMPKSEAVSFAERMAALVAREQQRNPGYGAPMKIEDPARFPHGASAPVANGNAAPAGTPSRKAF